MYDSERHNRHTTQHQQARYHLRGGIALAARKAKVTGKPATDSVGRPLLYANEMSERHNLKTIEKWVRASDRPAMLGLSMSVDRSNPKAATWP